LGAWEKDRMTLLNLRDVRDKQTIQEAADEVTDPYPAKPDEEISSSPVPTSQRRRLDVDEVLRRSLPRLTAEEL
jgi:hypothetical protein